ncbi:MAG: SseB family protein [Lachnospiraceae bacterium]|nr:SseB family protein [Lachnospiraceae bacterium]
MRINESASNPMLVGAMQLLKAENTPENQKLLTTELLAATLLAPARIFPDPIRNEDGTLSVPEKAQIQFPMLTAADGKKFFVAYTDEASMKKNDGDVTAPTPEEFREYHMSINIREFFRMLVTRDPAGNENPCSGVVINPFNENIVVSKQMALAVMQQEMELAKKRIENGQEGAMARRPEAGNIIRFPGIPRPDED